MNGVWIVPLTYNLFQIQSEKPRVVVFPSREAIGDVAICECDTDVAGDTSLSCTKV